MEIKKIKPKIIKTIFVSITFIMTSNVVLASKQIPIIKINGVMSTDLSGDLIVKDDRIYIPLRKMSEQLGINLDWEEKEKEVNINNNFPKNIFFIDKIKNEDISLYALNKDDNGRLDGFILSDNGINKYFPWTAYCAVSSKPEMYVINQNKHIAVIKTIGRGSGVRTEKTSIVDKNTMDEIQIIDPVEYIQNNLKIACSTKDIVIGIGDNQFTFSRDEVAKNTDDETIKFIIPASLTGFYGYKVVDDKVVLQCSLRVSKNYLEPIGYLEITHKFENNQYIFDNIQFKKGYFPDVK